MMPASTWCSLKPFVVVVVAVFVACQQPGSNRPENHPALIIQSCTKSNGCKDEAKRVVLDANFRTVYSILGPEQYCVLFNKWNTSVCPNGPTCAQNCALDGADNYEIYHGIKASGSSLTLAYATYLNHFFNIGSRVFLMDDDKYKIFTLKNREFTFDVDLSLAPCGINGALYFVEMDSDGGMSRFPGNKAGARFGTGYCSSQCSQKVYFINGEGNCEDWNSDKQTGHYGSCCNEVDIWQGNSMATTYTPHVCSVSGQSRCEGTACGSGSGQRYKGVCDKDGCDFNLYRLGNKTFFGPGKVIDTTKPFTVVTQFITTNSTDSGDLSEIRRIWKQDGKVYRNTTVSVNGNKYSSLTDAYCDAQKMVFNDTNSYEELGGNRAMGNAMDRGMVLTMSILDDPDTYMLWLDSNFPPDKSPSIPGVARGPCDISSGRPDDLIAYHNDSAITFSNIKYGDIGSTTF